MNSSELLSRPLSVRWNTRHFSRLGHEEVLKGVEDVIDSSLVKAIQFTENTSFITLKSQEAKENLIIDGIVICETFSAMPRGVTVLCIYVPILPSLHL